MKKVLLLFSKDIYCLEVLIHWLRRSEREKGRLHGVCLEEAEIRDVYDHREQEIHICWETK